MAAFTGLKGSQPSAPTSTPDTLFSDDILEIIGGVSEGPIKGPADGLRSIFINDTALVDSAGTPSLVNFDLHFHKGQNPATPIVPNLGATGSATSVGVSMDTNVPIVRTGSHTNIDFIAVRIVINRLLYQNPQYGEFIASAAWTIELKPHSATSWTNIGTVTPPPAFSDDGSMQRYYELNNGDGKINSPEARDVFIRATAPSAAEVTENNSIWANSADLYRPKLWNSATLAWDIPTGLTYTAGNGTTTYNVWQWTENGIPRRMYTGFLTTPPSDMGQYDLWITPTGVLNNSEDTAYSWNGSSWSNGLKYGLPVVETPGQFVVSGKTTSPYVRECLLRVNRINEPYDIRVVKTTPPNNIYYYGDIAFESFVELSQQTYTFNDLSVIHLTVRASDQLSGQPKLTADCEGRTIRVPSNYNPVTRTYTGVWDGTWQIAYSNNPAFIVNDLVTNDRYGLSAYRTTTLDKWAVYAFGQHCDLHGFTYNELITEARPIEDAVDYICGTAGGRFVDLHNGFSTILFDADDQPAVALFTEENVVDGVFSYSFTDVTTRPNDITVSYVDPTTNWAENRRRVTDDESIAKYGRIPEEFIAVGCISETEAIKRARLRLITAKTERTMVTFKTNRQGIYLSRFDVILVADPDSKFGISGRIKEVTGSNSFTLRDPIAFETGLTYTVTITKADGSLFTTSLVGATGTKTLLQTLDVLPALPEFATFAISCTSTIGTPKAFRVTSIDMSDSDPDNVAISAMEVNRTKWAFIDSPITPISGGGSGWTDKSISPITNLKVSPSTNSGGTQDAQLSWSPTPSTYFKFYRIYQSVGGGNPAIVAETRDTRFTAQGLKPSTYRWTVVAVSLDGRESLPVTLEHTVAGVSRSVAPPTNLRLLNGTSTTTFAEQSPTFAWEASVDPFLSTYRVQIVNTSTSAVVYSLDTTNLSFRFDYTQNSTAFGGTPSRTFLVRVYAIDKTNTLSAPVTLTVSNPQPAAPTTVVLSTDLFRLLIGYARSPDPDFAGALVYCSTTEGFTPGAGNLIYDGPNTSAETVVNEGQTKYVRVAFYDTFDKTILGYSPEFSLVGTGLRPNSVAYDKLTAALQTFVDVQTPLPGIVATHTSQISTLTTQTSALAGSVTTITASISDINTTLATHTSQISTLATTTSSLTTSLSTLTAAVNSTNTTVAAQATAIADLSGEVYGQWMVKIQSQNTTSSGTIKTISGFGLAQSTHDGVTTSDFVVQADRFSVIPTYSSSTAQDPVPVFIIGTRDGVATLGIKGSMYLDGTITATALNVSTLSAISANVGTVTAGVLKSADNKFVIDLTARTITISD